MLGRNLTDGKTFYPRLRLVIVSFRMKTKSSAVAETARRFGVIEYFVKSLKVIRNDNVE